MTKSDQSRAIKTLANVIHGWIMDNCEEYEVGLWYDGQEFDMAAAAVAALAASSNGQRYAEKEG